MKKLIYFSRNRVLFTLFFITLFTQCKEENNWANKTILVTAPVIYNERLSNQINHTGMKALPFPVLTTNLIDQNAEVDSILLNLDRYDWISLTSRNAIKAYIKRAGELDIPLSQLQAQNYCAIGEDQELLRSFGLESIIENEESSPKGIVQAIKKMDGEGKRIAVFVPQVIGFAEPNVIPNFIQDLQDIGLNVTRVNAYTTSICHPDNETKILHKIKNGSIDLIAFTSTGEIKAILSLIGGSEKLKNTPIACFGPYTYKNARKLGLEPTFMAKDFSSFEGYVDAMTDYFIQESALQTNYE